MKKKKSGNSAAKKKRGRPSKYDDKYAAEMIAYFSRKPYEIKETAVTDKKGNSKTINTVDIADVPFFSAFAREIGVSHDTLLEWCKKHELFSAAYETAKQLQAEILITNGLRGNYNPGFACFTAKNILGWTDKQAVNHSGKVGQEHSGEISIDGYDKEEVADIIRELRAIRTRRARTAAIN